MKKSRNIFLILIAIFALFAAALSILSLITTTLDILKNYNGNLQSVKFDLLISNIIDLAFSFVEITVGFNLIKDVKKDNYFECYKQTSGLLTAIITPLFVNMILNLIFSYIYKTPIESFDITLIILFFVIFTLTSFVRPLSLKRSVKGLDIIILLASILTLSIFVIDYNTYFSINEGITLDLISNVINCIMMVFLVVFSFISLIAYSKDPQLEIVESRHNEDVDVIDPDIDGKFEKVKIYSFRGVDNKMSTCSKVFEIIGCVFCLAFSILFTIENNFHELLKEGIDKIIEIFTFSSSSSIYESLEIFIKLFITLMTLLYSLNYFIGILTNNPKYKYYSIFITRIGTLLLTILFLTRMLTIASVIMYQNFDLSDLNIFDAVLVILFVVNSFAKKSYKNSLKKISEGIQQTDTYHEHIGRIVSLNITCGIISIVSLLLYAAYNYLSTDVLYYSFALLIMSIIFVTIGTMIEKKHPISEYIVVKRKKIDLK